VNQRTLRLDSVRCYLRELGGEPVATSLGVTVGAFTSILDVATPPAVRGRVYGTAARPHGAGTIPVGVGVGADPAATVS
jgi:hypothetical protein